MLAHLGGLPGQGDLLRAVTCCAADGMAMATSRSGVLPWVDSLSSCCPCSTSIPFWQGSLSKEHTSNMWPFCKRSTSLKLRVLIWIRQLLGLAHGARAPPRASQKSSSRRRSR